MPTPPPGRPAPKRPAPKPHFRLAIGSIFWRAALLMLLVGEYRVWRLVEQWVPARMPVKRVFAFLYFQPRAAFFAFFAGAIAAVACDVAFRLLVRGLMVRWYNPRSLDPSTEAPLAFRLELDESVVLTVAGRLVDGPRRRPQGTLILTDRRLWFSPYSWNVEPWERSLVELAEIRLEHPERRVLGLVRGYPENLVLVDVSGESRAFVLVDPIRVFDSVVLQAAGREQTVPGDAGGVGPVPPSPPDAWPSVLPASRIEL